MKSTLVGVLVILIAASAYGDDGDSEKKDTKAATTKPPKSPTCPKQGKDFYVQIKILGQGEYQYEMASVESAAFQNVREKVYDCILQTYDDYNFYQDTLVLSIENSTGGFVVGAAVRFTKDGDGHMNRLSQKIQAGKLCDMETEPKFIKCNELDQSMLYPMANCPAPCGGDLNCWPACDAACCTQTQEQTIYLPVAPPPPPPPMTTCAAGCPETCAPSCSPTCCFVQKRMLPKLKQKLMSGRTAPLTGQ